MIREIALELAFSAVFYPISHLAIIRQEKPIPKHLEHIRNIGVAWRTYEQNLDAASLEKASKALGMFELTGIKVVSATANLHLIIDPFMAFGIGDIITGEQLTFPDFASLDQDEQVQLFAQLANDVRALQIGEDLFERIKLECANLPGAKSKLAEACEKVTNGMSQSQAVRESDGEFSRRTLGRELKRLKNEN